MIDVIPDVLPHGSVVRQLGVILIRQGIHRWIIGRKLIGVHAVSPYMAIPKVTPDVGVEKQKSVITHRFAAEVASQCFLVTGKAVIMHETGGQQRHSEEQRPKKN